MCSLGVRLILATSVFLPPAQMSGKACCNGRASRSFRHRVRYSCGTRYRFTGHGAKQGTVYFEPPPGRERTLEGRRQGRGLEVENKSPRVCRTTLHWRAFLCAPTLPYDIPGHLIVEDSRGRSDTYLSDGPYLGKRRRLRGRKREGGAAASFLTIMVTTASDTVAVVFVVVFVVPSSGRMREH